MRRFWRRRRGDEDANGRRGAAAGATRAVYGLVGALASAIDIVVGIVCVVIVLAILLVVLGANQDNAVVGAIHDAGEFLAGPFKDVFERDDEKQRVAINWGIAVAVYFVAGRAVTALLRRGSG